MILNTIIFALITFIILFLSDIINRKVGKKLFPLHFRRIEVIDKRLMELRNLIRLTLIHNDKKTTEKLQKEYSEQYNKVFFIKLMINSIFLVPILMFAVIINYLPFIWELILPPVNLVIFMVGIYFLIKFSIVMFKNFLKK